MHTPVILVPKHHCGTAAAGARVAHVSRASLKRQPANLSGATRGIAALVGRSALLNAAPPRIVTGSGYCCTVQQRPSRSLNCSSKVLQVVAARPKAIHSAIHLKLAAERFSGLMAAEILLGDEQRWQSLTPNSTASFFESDSPRMLVLARLELNDSMRSCCFMNTNATCHDAFHFLVTTTRRCSVRPLRLSAS